MKDFGSRKRDIIVGVVILVVIAGAFYFFKLRKTTPTVPQATSGPSIQQIEQNIADKFKFVVPDNVEKTALKDVSGGNGSGIATRTEILADLPDPDAGYFYQAWLQNSSGKLISLGQMQMAKGGWLIEYNGAAYPGYNKIIVSLERVFDTNLEKGILEGSF